MSVARKRAKVKKKRSAAAKRPRRKRPSVNTNARPKRPKRPKRPTVSEEPKKTRRSKKPAKDRSKAAKKSWETRRLNKLKEEAKAGDTEAHLAFLRQPQVARQIRDQLIRTELIRPGMVETVETQMLSRLIIAEQLGIFDETAAELAEEFDWDIREVYTLWHSP